jgi:hypothetical protein
VNIIARDILDVRTPDATDLRAALRAAVLKRDDAVVNEESAARALAKAQLLLDEANRRLSNFDDLDAEIASHRRANIKAFAQTGERFDERLPPGLQARVKARAEAQEQVGAYRVTFQELTAELQAAVKNVKHAQWAAGQAAGAVLIEEAEHVAAQFEAARTVMRRYQDQLTAMTFVRLPSYPGETTQPLLKLPYALQMTLQGLNDPRPMQAGNAGSPVAVCERNWNSYLAALLQDADAVLTEEGN